MSITRGVAAVLTMLSLLFVSGCASTPTMSTRSEAQQVEALAATLRSLGPQVDPEEADRAARIAYARTRELAIQYEITDSPLVHNTKVNMGLKPRGLCWHWAEDMQARLASESFKTLDLHRAIANFDSVLIDHSTLIVSARGDRMKEGVVLDPWRLGGVLFWSPVSEDTKYDWAPRDQVLDWKRRRATGGTAALAL